MFKETVVETIKCTRCGGINKAKISPREIEVLKLCKCSRDTLKKRKELAGVHRYNSSSQNIGLFAK